MTTPATYPSAIVGPQPLARSTPKKERKKCQFHAGFCARAGGPAQRDGRRIWAGAAEREGPRMYFAVAAFETRESLRVIAW
jgi:hypothetical protein